MTLDDVGPGVTTQRYHNNGRLIMLEVNCIKFSLGIQNSLGMIMCKFHARQSKTGKWQHLSAYFLNTPRTHGQRCNYDLNNSDFNKFEKLSFSYHKKSIFYLGRPYL